MITAKPMENAAHFTRNRTVCGICSGTCGMTIKLQNGRVTAIEGDRDHPVSAGHICPKGHADVFSLEYVSNADELDGTFRDLVPLSPRVLVSGCPIGGDANKVFKVIEEAGGVIVAMEACSGMKRYALAIEEGTDDPVASLARACLKVPCMTPNTRRLEALDPLIERFRPRAVVDVILQACHSYNIESYRIEKHVREKHKIPVLKVETDFSESDRAMIRTRVQAIFENL